MSLQIPIQKDIGEYEEKIVGKLSFRTLVCVAGGLRIGDPRGSDMPFLDRHRSRRRRFPRHVRIDPVLARRFLASIRDARGEVRTPSVFTPHERPEAPLRKPGTEASGAHRARSAKSQGEEDVQTQRSGGQ